jgi:hypothetical protein
MNQSANEHPSLKQLYPSLSPEELRVASENIDRYLQLILRICKRLESEKSAGQDSDLASPTM